MTVIKKGRKIHISNLAEDIANHYFTNSEVNPIELLIKKNISYSFNDYGDYFDGMLEHFNGKFHVYLNQTRLKTESSSRARFTISHELGHYFLDEHRQALEQGLAPSHPSINFGSSNIVEREADLFAACLLMPETRFLNDCKNIPFSHKLVDNLSKKYNVSVAATLLRFCFIGHEPIMVVFTNRGKVMWTRNSEDFKFYKILTPNGKVSPHSAVGEYYFKGRKYYEPETVFAKDWFDNIYEEDAEKEFHEYSFYYDSIGMALTILWEK